MIKMGIYEFIKNSFFEEGALLIWNLVYMGISTHFYKKYHIYEPGAECGFWSIHVDGIFCEKRRKRKRKEGGKKGGRKKRKGREEVHC